MKRSQRVITKTRNAPELSDSIFPALIYRSLDWSRDIRVLKVSYDSDVDHDAEMPTLSLQVVSLTDPISYVAVSYMWSSQDTRVNITIDKSSLKVSPSLRRMVFDLSSQTQSRYLWIDAICINQDDVEERNAQVRLMGDIYSRANYIIAYLDGSNHSAYRSAYLNGRGRNYLSLYSALDSIRNAVTLRDPKTLKPGLDYVRFFDNDYFTRRWIIQELCLARSVIIRCDGYELSMGLLERYFGMLGPDHKHNKSRAANICRWRQRLPATQSRLEDLLYDHEKAGCKVSLDKVYALLSLSSAGLRHITIDYNTTPMELLISVVRMSASKEDLKPSRVLSLACFLRQHLEIAPTEFEQRMNTCQDSRAEGKSPKIYTHVRVRGILLNTRIDADVEDGLNRLRPYLPPMRHYSRVQLIRTNPENVNDLEIFDPCDSQDDSYEGEIDAMNLWAFSTVPSEAEASEGSCRRGVLAGISTAAVRVDDEVWQFPRTPVAMIARPTETGYDLVARAMIPNSSTWTFGADEDININLERHDLQLSNMASWIKDQPDDEHSSNVKTIAVTTYDLLKLMTWADTFAD